MSRADPSGFALGPINYLVLLTGLISMAIATGSGRNLAKNQVNYLVTKSPTPIVILRQYGSSLIGVNIDKNKTVSNGIFVIEKSNMKDYGVLISEKIGPIHPNPSMKP